MLKNAQEYLENTRNTHRMSKMFKKRSIEDQNLFKYFHIVLTEYSEKLR